MLVRNITGTFQSPNNADSYWNGCFYVTSTVVDGPYGGGDDKLAKFDASRVVTTSSEVRPINISAIPLIMAV